MRTGKIQAQAETASGTELRLVAANADDLERCYAADAWRADDLGVRAARCRGAVNFIRINPPWLREATKRWARHRLATGCAFGTLLVDVFALQYFSQFLAAHDPPVLHPEQIDRPLLERYLAGGAAARRLHQDADPLAPARPAGRQSPSGLGPWHSGRSGDLPRRAVIQAAL
jgi:hypothetical protein